jgi:hypothetical protein
MLNPRIFIFNQLFNLVTPFPNLLRILIESFKSKKLIWVKLTYSLLINFYLHFFNV